MMTAQYCNYAEKQVRGSFENVFKLCLLGGTAPLPQLDTPPCAAAGHGAVAATRQHAAHLCSNAVYDEADSSFCTLAASVNYTVSQKKQDTKLLAIISLTVIRFSKFFH